jgi:hypothetical protein
MYFWFDLTQILISKKFEKEIVFKSSVLAWIRIRIRIEQKCWIQIRKKSIRIHNPASYVLYIAIFYGRHNTMFLHNFAAKFHEILYFLRHEISQNKIKILRNMKLNIYKNFANFSEQNFVDHSTWKSVFTTSEWVTASAWWAILSSRRLLLLLLLLLLILRGGNKFSRCLGDGLQNNFYRYSIENFLK